MVKVKKVATYRDKYSTTIEYEYRGKRYDVEYPNCVTYCVTPPKIQHEDAQRKIDAEIEREQNEKDTKGFDLDEIWEFMGW